MSDFKAYFRKLLEKSSFIKVSFITLFLYLYISNFFRPHILDSLIWKSWYGHFCKEIYIFIENNDYASWLSIAFMTAFSIYLSYKFSAKKYHTYIRLLSITLVLWIAFDNSWIYASVVWDKDLRWWLAAICILPGILSFFRHKTNDASESGHTTSAKGLTTDKIRYKVDTTITEYAKEIANRITATKANESSYAIGLEGSWGCGKSTFLDSLKAALPVDAVKMDFNPWLSLTEKSVIQDFFDSLADTIYEHINKDLYSPISKYGDALLAIDNAGGLINTLKNILSNYNKNSLRVLKRDIAKSLKESDKKVFIFIDDLDRLDSEEMFEVLRLIRNTADFPNLVYITAYDKEYVEHQLHNIGIEKAGQYLEKIFNLEIGLPKTEDRRLEQEFIYELSDMIPSDIEVSNIPTRFVRGRLHSYRDIKRFARLFSVNHMFMLKNVGKEEFNVGDLFVLELLHYTNHALYVALKNSIETSLTFQSERKGLYRFHLNESLQKSLEQTYGALDLTNYIFENESPDYKSLCFPNNYRRYFSFQLEIEDITTSDFYNWLQSGASESTQAFDNLVSKTGRRRSLLFQFSTYDISSLSLAELQLFFKGLIKLFTGPYKLKDEVKRILIDRLHPSENSLIDSDEFFMWLRDELSVIKDIPSIIRLSGLFQSINKSDAGLENRLELLETDNMLRFLDNESPEVMELLDGSKPIRIIYGNSIRWKNHSYVDDEGDIREYKEGTSPLFDIMSDYFEKHKSPDKKNFIESLTCYESYDPNFGECYLESLPEELADDNIRSVFGNTEYYKNFLNKAFNS